MKVLITQTTKNHRVAYTQNDVREISSIEDILNIPFPRDERGMFSVPRFIVMPRESSEYIEEYNLDADAEIEIYDDYLY